MKEEGTVPIVTADPSCKTRLLHVPEDMKLIYIYIYIYIYTYLFRHAQTFCIKRSGPLNVNMVLLNRQWSICGKQWAFRCEYGLTEKTVVDMWQGVGL